LEIDETFNLMRGTNLPPTRHKRERVLMCSLASDVGGNTCKQTVQCFPIKKPAGGNYCCNPFGVGDAL